MTVPDTFEPLGITTSLLAMTSFATEPVKVWPGWLTFEPIAEPRLTTILVPAGMTTGGFFFSSFASFLCPLDSLPDFSVSLVALLLYISVRRCRYFGNTAPLMMVLLLFPLVTTQTVSRPWLWALPFLFTFVGGVFADALETRQRRLFLGLSGAILLTQAMLCLALLPEIAR